MPCDKLAVVSAKLALDAKDLIGANDKVQRALQIAVAKVMEVETDRVYFYSGRTGISMEVDGCAVSITRDGIEVSSSYRSSARVEEVKSKIGLAVKAVLGLLAQAKTVAALKSKYRVTAQTTAKSGAVMLTVEVGG